MIKHRPMRNLSPRIWGEKQSWQLLCLFSVGQNQWNDILPPCARVMPWPHGWLDLISCHRFSMTFLTFLQPGPLSPRDHQAGQQMLHRPLPILDGGENDHQTPLCFTALFSKPWICLMPTPGGSLWRALFISKDQLLVLRCFVYSRL